MKSRLLTRHSRPRGDPPGFPPSILLCGPYPCHAKGQLSELTLPIHASEPLHMLVTGSGRLFPPGKFPLTLPGSGRSHLLREAFPDSPSPLYLPFQGVYILGLSPPLSVSSLRAELSHPRLQSEHSAQVQSGWCSGKCLLSDRGPGPTPSPSCLPPDLAGHR